MSFTREEAAAQLNSPEFRAKLDEDVRLAAETIKTTIPEFYAHFRKMLETPVMVDPEDTRAEVRGLLDGYGLLKTIKDTDEIIATCYMLSHLAKELRAFAKDEFITRKLAELEN